jgi:hypothetical protein
VEKRVATRMQTLKSVNLIHKAGAAPWRWRRTGGRAQIQLLKCIAWAGQRHQQIGEVGVVPIAGLGRGERRNFHPPMAGSDMVGKHHSSERGGGHSRLPARSRIQEDIIDVPECGYVNTTSAQMSCRMNGWCQDWWRRSSTHAAGMDGCHSRGPDLVVAAVEELRQTRSGWRQHANTSRG